MRLAYPLLVCFIGRAWGGALLQLQGDAAGVSAGSFPIFTKDAAGLHVHGVGAWARVGAGTSLDLVASRLSALGAARAGRVGLRLRQVCQGLARRGSLTVTERNISAFLLDIFCFILVFFVLLFHYETP